MSQGWQRYLEEHQSRFREEFLDLLRIPSVSTSREAAGEVRRAAAWTAERLKAAGMEHVQVLETGGHPVVYGDWLHAPGKPTLLFYGHFDVQPAEPLELWEKPPFEPWISEEGKLFARGATDMKGNLLLPVVACEALLQTTGSLPVNVKFLYEGEEEIGSPSLAAFIDAHQELLNCDLGVSADAGNGSPEEPTVGCSTRGLCGLQVNLRTANTDMHSGTGGLTPNPIHALVRLLDSMRDESGRILVDGFYDEVQPLTDADRAAIAAAPINPDEVMAQAGIRASFGEPEFTPLERASARPTLEFNGIWGGFQGEGVKTVIPCEAHAKITCRLVADQDPGVIREKVIAHIRKHTSAYAEVSVDVLPGEAFAYRVPADHWGQRALEAVLAETSGGKAARPVFGGGTVPVLGMLQQKLGVATVSLGCSQSDERAHAPNEFVRLANFELAQRRYCLFLERIGAQR